MDIQEQIDQFLQIPEIKEIFSDHDIHWHVGEYSQGWYFDFSVPDYEKGFFLGAWNAWQAVKAQAVPEGFVLVKMDDLELLRDSTLKIKYASLNNDSDRIFSDIEDIQLSIERLIELQEPAND